MLALLPLLLGSVHATTWVSCLGNDEVNTMTFINGLRQWCTAPARGPLRAVIRLVPVYPRPSADRADGRMLVQRG